MKAILEFDLDAGNDDALELEMALNASKLSLIIWDLDQFLRGRAKYGTAEEQTIDVDDMREKLRDLLNDYGLSFEHKIFS